jgi:ABC-type lipoprotein release transport system permease subunit
MAMAAVVLLMTLAGFLAALGPARQGLKIDPTEALREPVR